MSRHHMLPPIVYVPQQKPKKIESRKPRIQMRSAGAIDDMADIEETKASTGSARPAPAGNRPPLQNFAAIEGSEQKPRRPAGRLSETTLKVMLQAQELE
jgi:hypothetical protein